MRDARRRGSPATAAFACRGDAEKREEDREDRMDAGVIACFKALYRRRVLSRLALNLDISIRERRPAPDFKVSLLMAVQFIFAAWAEVGSSTIANCFCMVGFAGDSSEAEVKGHDAPADAEMTELWSSEFLHANDALATNEDLTNEAIVAAVTGAEDDRSDDEEEPEPMQVVSHQEALEMIDSLRDFVFAKTLPPGQAQQLDALQKDVNKMASKQSKLTAYGFLPAKK
ncbi:hypothetical protein HPB48_021808 [Haemaphysalis longicornis]|uniref:DDE-1 domain-containing protein n=1 Tax=Haemaphysalis longicornis TaxID=44386 RepID=A0A9J6FV10_HAELO|nr:hypothetical protein HPB48_021808 [Haemaphysalis longicornis]